MPRRAAARSSRSGSGRASRGGKTGTAETGTSGINTTLVHLLRAGGPSEGRHRGRPPVAHTSRVTLGRRALILAPGCANLSGGNPGPYAACAMATGENRATA
jgi:hypothetical protein